MEAANGFEIRKKVGNSWGVIQLAKTPEGIELIEVGYAGAMLLLESEALKQLEAELAKRWRMKVLPCDSVPARDSVIGEVSVCGLTPAELLQYIQDNHDGILRFVACMEEDLDDEEMQDPDSSVVEVHGFTSGFGLTHAIHHHFIAQRTPKEFLAFLKNRRTPRHTKYAKELEAAFASACEQ